MKVNMSRVCEITGKHSSAGNSRSHACNATKRKFRPNLFVKKVVDPKTGLTRKMKISASALRTLSKTK
jgi:large subunit ribosomal protein L28